MMSNYQSTPRSNRPKGFLAKHVLQFALFAAFSLWLLYQISQPNGSSRPVRQVSSEGISNILGRKGSAGLLESKSTPIAYPGMTLEDVTNPGEEGEIPRYSKEVEEVELKEENVNNTLSLRQYGQMNMNEDGSLAIKKSNISFSDENGIPQDIRDKFIGIESSKPANGTRVKVQRFITTRAGNGNNRTVEKS
nr:uncharacterized protein LOC122600885 isoform X2 [Erigeron canadensis]XP_043629599.1 uncharacterized protein LOC122600885 isoform X2 [Erigeron canadensis]